MADKPARILVFPTDDGIGIAMPDGVTHHVTLGLEGRRGLALGLLRTVDGESAAQNAADQHLGRQFRALLKAAGFDPSPKAPPSRAKAPVAADSGSGAGKVRQSRGAPLARSKRDGRLMVDEEKRKRILDVFKPGMTLDQIREAAQVGKGLVAITLKEVGLWDPRGKVHQKRVALAEVIREKVALGMSDRDIAAELSINRHTITRTRRFAGIAPSKTNVGGAPAQRVGEIVALAKAGKTVAEIIDATGLTDPTIRRRLRLEGIEPGRPRVGQPAEVLAEIRHLIGLELTDTEVARVLDPPRSRKWVENLRNRYAIPARLTKSLTCEVIEKRLRKRIAEGMSDAEVAEAEGWPVGAVAVRRKLYGGAYGEIPEGVPLPPPPPKSEAVKASPAPVPANDRPAARAVPKPAPKAPQPVAAREVEVVRSKSAAEVDAALSAPIGKKATGGKGKRHVARVTFGRSIPPLNPPSEGQRKMLDALMQARPDGTAMPLANALAIMAKAIGSIPARVGTDLGHMMRAGYLIRSGKTGAPDATVRVAYDAKREKVIPQEAGTRVETRTRPDGTTYTVTICPPRRAAGADVLKNFG